MNTIKSLLADGLDRRERERAGERERVLYHKEPDVPNFFGEPRTMLFFGVN